MQSASEEIGIGIAALLSHFHLWRRPGGGLSVRLNFYNSFVVTPYFASS
jgi:hypothetical protein